MLKINLVNIFYLFLSSPFFSLFIIITFNIIWFTSRADIAPWAEFSPQDAIKELRYVIAKFTEQIPGLKRLIYLERRLHFGY